MVNHTIILLQQAKKMNSSSGENSTAVEGGQEEAAGLDLDLIQALLNNSVLVSDSEPPGLQQDKVKPIVLRQKVRRSFIQ